MADQATRPLRRWRPVPTGNILQALPALRSISLVTKERKTTKVGIDFPKWGRKTGENRTGENRGKAGRGKPGTDGTYPIFKKLTALAAEVNPNPKG
jgi:hypothetical protein